MLIAYLIQVTVGQTGDVWRTFGVVGFITGTEWIPSPVEGDPVFGALPFIYGTLVTSAIAMALAVPLAVGIALATTHVLPRRVRGPIAALVDLLAAVPSVVFGFWGVVVLVPAARPVLEWVSAHNLRTLAIAATLFGLGAVATGGALRVVLASAAAALAGVIALSLGGALDPPFTLLEGPVLSGSYLIAGLVLAIMVLPIVTAVTREVLLTVPREQQEAAYALGATRWEMIRHSVLPWARSGIVGASALGLGRAVGETIALAMVLGNVPDIGGSLLGPGSTAAGVIALETGEAGDLQLAALTALAVVLFALTFVINSLARLLVTRDGARRGRVGRLVARRRPAGALAEGGPDAAAAVTGAGGAGAPAGLPAVPRRRRLRSRGAEGAIVATVLMGVLPLALILGQIVVVGVGQISGAFLTEVQPVDPNAVEGFGIGNALVGTLILGGIATALAAPLGVLTALFIAEARAAGGTVGRIGGAMSLFTDVLLGMPSIVAGITVYLAIVVATEQFSALAGGIALAVVMFPIVVRTADEVLRLVPPGQKEAALALGAPRWRTAWSVVLPAAAPGILTGIVLALARAAGETAPLLFTSLGNQRFSTDLLEPIAALPALIFGFTVQVRTDQSVAFAWGATFVLVAVILFLNVGARLAVRLTRTPEPR